MQTNTISFEQMMALFQESRELIDKNSREYDSKLKELIEERKKTEIIQKQTEKQIKELGKQIGGLHRERGTYTEIILMPSIEDTILNKFKLDSFDTNVRRKIKGDEIQIDAIGFTNSTRNEVLVVEVKTKLDVTDIDQIEKHLKRLDYFFPEHKDKKKYGLLVALYANKELIEKVHQRGFYFASIKNDLLKLENPKGFVPKLF